MRDLFMSLTCLLLWSAVGQLAAEDVYPRAELLVEPAQLAQADFAAEFVILDTRKVDAYTAGHIPGAIRVDHDAWSKSFGNGRDGEAWSQRIGELGIDNDTKVIVYDEKGMNEAGRIWWILSYWGVRDARLLNGGFPAWKAAEYPIEVEPPKEVKPADFRAVPRGKRLADMQQMLKTVAGSTMQIVDARSQGEYCGQDARNNKRAGAMPGAKHLDWTNLIDQQTLRFKPAAELRTLFEQAGIDLSQPAVAHCQSGGRSSVMVFALELMGAPDVVNYYASWNEWGNADDTPIEVPAVDEAKLKE